MTEKEIQTHYEQAGKIKPNFIHLKKDSLKLFVASKGDSSLKPLLLIHGAPSRWTAYLQYVDNDSLYKKHHLLAIDRPGYGFSINKKRPHKIYSLGHQAHAIALALDLNHSSEKAIIVSQSYGTPVAIKLASLYPEKIEKIILLSPAIDPENEKFFWFSPFGKIFFIKWFLPKRLNTATKEKYAHAKELKKLVPDYDKVNCEIIVAKGGMDWVITPSNLDFAKKMFATKNAKYYYFPTWGHRIAADHPDWVLKTIYNQQDNN